MQTKKYLALIPIYSNRFQDISQNFKLEVIGNLLTIPKSTLSNTQSLFTISLANVKYYGDIENNQTETLYIDNPGAPFEGNTFIFRDIASITFAEKFSVEEIVKGANKFTNLSINDGLFNLSYKDVIYNLIEYLHSYSDFKSKYENILTNVSEKILPFQIGGYKAISKTENNMYQTLILGSKQAVRFISSSLSNVLYTFKDKLSNNFTLLESTFKAIINSGVNVNWMIEASFPFSQRLSVKLTYANMVKYAANKDCFMLGIFWYNNYFKKFTVLPHIFNGTLTESGHRFDVSRTILLATKTGYQRYNHILSESNDQYKIYLEPNTYPYLLLNNLSINLETILSFVGNWSTGSTYYVSSYDIDPPIQFLPFPWTMRIYPFRTDYYSLKDNQYKNLIDIPSITTIDEIRKLLIDGARLLSALRTSVSVIDLTGHHVLNFRRIYQQPIDTLTAKYIDKDGNLSSYSFDYSWFAKNTDQNYCRVAFDYSVLKSQIYPIVVNSQFTGYQNNGFISVLQPVLVPRPEHVDATVEGDFTTIDSEAYYLWKRPSWNGEFAEFIFNLNLAADNPTDREAGFNNDIEYTIASLEAIEDLNYPKYALSQRYYQLNFISPITDNTSYLEEPFINILTTPFEKHIPVSVINNISSLTLDAINTIRRLTSLHTRLLTVDLTPYITKQAPTRTLMFVIQPECFDRFSLLSAVKDSTSGHLEYLSLIGELLNVGNDTAYFDLTTYDSTNFGLTQVFIFENDITKPLVPPKLKLRANLNQTPGLVVNYPVKLNHVNSETKQPKYVWIFNVFISDVDVNNKSVRYDYQVVKLDIENNQVITLFNSLTDSTINLDNPYVREFFNEYYPELLDTIAESELELAPILVPISYQLRYLIITNYTYTPLAIFVKDKALEDLLPVFENKVSSIDSINTDLKDKQFIIAKLGFIDKDVMDTINTNLKYQLGDINKLEMYLNNTLVLTLIANQFNILETRLISVPIADSDTTVVDISWVLDSTVLPELIFEEPKAIKVSFTDTTTNDTTELILDAFDIVSDYTEIHLDKPLTNYNVDIEIILK